MKCPKLLTLCIQKWTAICRSSSAQAPADKEKAAQTSQAAGVGALPIAQHSEGFNDDVQSGGPTDLHQTHGSQPGLSTADSGADSPAKKAGPGDHNLLEQPTVDTSQREGKESQEALGSEAFDRAGPVSPPSAFATNDTGHLALSLEADGDPEARGLPQSGAATAIALNKKQQHATNPPGEHAGRLAGTFASLKMSPVLQGQIKDWV